MSATIEARLLKLCQADRCGYQTHGCCHLVKSPPEKQPPHLVHACPIGEVELSMTALETKQRIREVTEGRHALRQHFLDSFETLMVLVVDDDANFRQALKDRIESIVNRRCIVVEAESGQSAVEVMAAVRMSLIFVDLRMPKHSGDGISLLTEVKNFPEKYRDTTVLVVSGIADDSVEVIQAKALGFPFIIRKSEIWDDLQSMFGK